MAIQWVELASAVVGSAGTLILFFSSYALEPFSGGVFGSPAVTAENDRIRKSNRLRKRWQQVGLLLLLASFLLQVVAAIV